MLNQQLRWVDRENMQVQEQKETCMWFSFHLRECYIARTNKDNRFF